MSANILVADDSKSVRSFLSKLLSGAGYSVITAEDGKQAWDLVQKEKVDLIVSDLVMPEMNGMQFCELVKRDNDLKHIYFIILSTKAEVETKIQGLTVGADDYVVKSIDEKELLSRIKAGLRIRSLEKELSDKQAFLFQSEKMATIGQIAAGVAHEINNPLSFIVSNLNTFAKYNERLVDYINFQDDLVNQLKNTEVTNIISEKRKKSKIDIVINDLATLISESLEGADRVKKIVQDLKSFSRLDEAGCKLADINECIESTLNIVWNELKYKAKVIKNYGELPLTKCYPQQLNQVFMNLLVNAAQAIEKDGEVTISSKAEDNSIYITIADNGCGMSQDIIQKITEPFFTTKEVGKGTGIGLSISLDIIKKHKGELTVKSEEGVGSEFTIKIPVINDAG